MKRVPELIDVWFDSGSMPVAQWHYPFENQEKFKEQFPADYICEAVDQTRGWFYSLHAISTLLFDQECFKNVICLGLILDGDGSEDVQITGQYRQPVGCAEPTRRGCHALVSVHRQPARAGTAFLFRSGGRGGAATSP